MTKETQHPKGISQPQRKVGKFVKLIFVLLVIAFPLQTQVTDLIYYHLQKNAFFVSDIFFSRFVSNKKNQNIILINMGESRKVDVATCVQKLIEYSPTVIGLDIKFADSQQSLYFQEIKKKYKKIVFASDIISNSDNENMRTLKIDEEAGDFYHGFTLFNEQDIEETDNQFPIIRRFNYKKQVEKEKAYLHFCMSITKLFNDSLFTQISKKINDVEYINYQYKQEDFTVFEMSDIIEDNFQKKDIEGKVVLIGYLGTYLGEKDVISDRFYTPMNEDYSIHQINTIPDMFGVVIWANVISMLLEQKLIRELSPITGYGIFLILIIFNTILFTLLTNNKRLDYWYFELTLSITIINFLVITYLGLWLLSNQTIFWNYNNLPLYTLLFLPFIVKILR